jgi:hypothetical protein
MRNAALFSLVVLSCIGPAGRAGEKEVTEGLKAILAVGKEGAGNVEAAAGWKAVVAGGTDALIPILKAFAGASPAARNWLKTAVAAIAEGEKAAGKLSADKLEEFVRSRVNDPAARAAAFDVFLSLAPNDAATFLANSVDDPSVEIRRAAVADRLKHATEYRGDDRVKFYRFLFDNVRDMDQAEDIAKRMHDELGDLLDLSTHFGYLATWQLAGPFDSPEGTGFAKSFPAGAGFDATKTYTGKGSKTFGWKKATAEPKHPNFEPKGPPFYCFMDVNKELGKSMDAVAYASCRFTIAQETPCEIRVGCQNAIQIFLNGKKLFEREAYHQNYWPDQHVAAGTLKAGQNEVLLKVVQNNQKEPWAQYWAFNCRVCDATGGKLPITPVDTPVPAAEGKEEKK